MLQAAVLGELRFEPASCNAYEVSYGLQVVESRRQRIKGRRLSLPIRRSRDREIDKAV
jgi:hypothetical protein